MGTYHLSLHRGPSRASSRLTGLDLARCVALLAIVAVHVLGRYGANGHLPNTYVFGNSVAPALFAVLIGTSLALARTSCSGSWQSFARGEVVRALFVAAVGLSLAELDSGIAVILTYLAVSFLAGLLFLRFRPFSLTLLATALALLLPLASFALRPHLPPRLYDAPTWQDLAHPVQMASHLLFTGYYPLAAWLPYVLIGLAVGKLPLRNLRHQLALCGGGTCVGLLALLLSHLLLSSSTARGALLTSSGQETWFDFKDAYAPGLYGTVPTDNLHWLLVAYPHSGTPLDLYMTAGFALAIMGLCLLLCGQLEKRSKELLEVVRVVSGAGAMTLSLYTLHVLMHSPLLPPEDTPRTLPLHLWVLLSVGAGFAALRLRGPLEALAGLALRSSRKSLGKINVSSE